MIQMLVWWGFIAVAAIFEPEIVLALVMVTALCLLVMWIGGKMGL